MLLRAVTRPIVDPFVGRRALALPIPAFSRDFGNGEGLTSHSGKGGDLTFTRASSATVIMDGKLATVGNNVLRLRPGYGALLEPGATNAIPYSEQLDNAAWTEAGATVAADQTTAPDDEITADRLTNAGTSGVVVDSFTVSAAAQVVMSAFVKNDDAVQSRLNLRDSTNTNEIGGVVINWSGATITSIVEQNSPDDIGFEYIGFGWWRVWIVGTMGVGGTNCQAKCAPQTGAASRSAYFWGVQAEEGVSPSSYIKTEGLAATRAADVLTCQSADLTPWFNQPEGTFLCEWSLLPRVATDGGNHYILQLFEDGNNLYRNVILGSATTVTIGYLATAGARTITKSPYDQTGVNRTAFVYKASDGAVSLNNSETATDGAVSLVTPTLLELGAFAGSSLLSGYIKRVAYWPERLNDALIQALTNG